VPSRGKLLPLRPAREEDDEVTVYVKGFLARGEEADHFDRWLACHDSLEQSHGWGAQALGYRWSSGSLLPRPVAALATAKGALDVFRVLRNVRHAAALRGVGVMVAEEVVLIAAHFVRQYVAATRSVREQADDQAEHLRELAARHRRVRVVAHSLGCHHVIEAVSRLEPEARPHEIHLCAPACREDDVAAALEGLARERTFLYFTEKDRLLDLAFTPVARGRALGFVGPKREYAQLTAIDASDHFDFWVHGEYKNRFSALVPAKGDDPCPTRTSPPGPSSS
jgi:hypothetical protein